ncbi:hypothetical protein [Pseudomarimonas arenosa]|uniref:Uncharacterized protein n=1 Tax=Pseudomarimonas arenosa TaxID=2774145 RepID=A0AAW3ZP23_9GAMM|nr:hypothetical protein [Pseudomarimonas arenosa]MBD8527269.1 hypothetical protein [Pseudomarimonas arenosa]
MSCSLLIESSLSLLLLVPGASSLADSRVDSSAPAAASSAVAVQEDRSQAGTAAEVRLSRVDLLRSMREVAAEQAKQVPVVPVTIANQASAPQFEHSLQQSRAEREERFEESIRWVWPLTGRVPLGGERRD